MMNFHEEQFVRSFIVPAKVERYLGLLQSDRGRKKLRAGMYHCPDIDYRFARLLGSAEQNPKSIERILKSKGAPDYCYLFSADSVFDGREVALSDALNEVVDSGSGTLVSCVAGKLGYFEFEDAKERYILER